MMKCIDRDHRHESGPRQFDSRKTPTTDARPDVGENEERVRYSTCFTNDRWSSGPTGRTHRNGKGHKRCFSSYHRGRQRSFPTNPRMDIEISTVPFRDRALKLDEMRLLQIQKHSFIAVPTPDAHGGAGNTVHRLLPETLLRSLDSSLSNPPNCLS
jgi:hypothetical protein